MEKKAKIYHAFPPNFECLNVPETDYKEIAEVSFEHDIEKCADIDIILDYVYNVSQNVTENWLNGVAVKPLDGRKFSRSTSTGDIVEVNGTKYRCEWIGWKKIS